MNTVVRFPARPSADDMRTAMAVLQSEIEEIDEAMRAEVTARTFNRLRRRRDALENVTQWLRHSTRKPK